jgi:hypothetical protein
VRIKELVENLPDLATLVEPLLVVRRVLREQIAVLHRRLLAIARDDTRVWQLAVLPSAEAYCGATPTECVPFFGIAVSSITSTASLPPTRLSA